LAPARLTASLAVAFTAGFGLALGARAQCDDFNSGEARGWSCYDPISTAGGGVFGPQNSCTVTNGSYRLQSRPTPAFNLVGPGRVAALREEVAYTDFYAAVDVVEWDETAPQAFGIVASARELGLGTTDGYAFTYRVDRQTVFIARFTNENPIGGTIGGGLGGYTLIKGRTYRLVFKRIGDQFRGEMYELPELAVPVLTAVASDAAYPSGVNGLIAYDYSAGPPRSTDVTFDNYCAMREEPVRLAVSRNGFGEILISWPASFTGYVLEWSPTLPGTTWTAETYFSNDSIHFVNPSAEDGPRYYRLRKEPTPAAK
jgi:hypothetical protein